MTRRKTQSGYALLEIMLAFAVGAIIITGMVSLGLVSVRALTASRASSEAGKIAQREVDRLKVMRDSLPWYNGTDGFYDKLKDCTTASPCYISSLSPTVSVAAGKKTETVGGFSVIYWLVTEPDPSPQKNYVKYTVEVNWDLKGLTKSYKIEGVFTNWK